MTAGVDLSAPVSSDVLRDSPPRPLTMHLPDHVRACTAFSGQTGRRTTNAAPLGTAPGGDMEGGVSCHWKGYPPRRRHAPGTPECPLCGRPRYAATWSATAY